MGRRHSWVVIALLAPTACHDRAKTTPAPPPSASVVVAPLRALPPRAVSTDAAFDLVATTDGAALGWAEPKTPTLSIALLDSRGRASGEPLHVPVPVGTNVDGVVEVSGVSRADRVGFAWVAAGAAGGQSFGTLGDASTRSFIPAAALGQTAVAEARERGHVAIGLNSKDQLLALRRGPDEPCDTDPERSCASFAFREILSTGPEARGLPLSVPAACPMALVGFVLPEDRWHYAVCSDAGGKPVTTAFSVTRTPFYAEAKSVLEGCTPIGMTALGDDAIVVGRCSDGPRAIRIGAMGVTLRKLDLSRAALSCSGAAPLLEIPGDAPIALSLGAAQSGLGSLLPTSVAPAGARAAWTGTSLLVATAQGGQLALERWECHDGKLGRNG